MNRHSTRIALQLLITMAVVLLAANVFAAPAAPAAPKVTIDAKGATPREVEDQTQQSIVRDYGKAWQNLSEALQQNRPDSLNASFVGFARERWATAIKSQAKAGLSRKVVDHGHKLQVLFYSIDGSAIQLRDTAQLEIQYLDGGKVVHSEQVKESYVVLMTPAENSWKVRLLQEIPPSATQQAALAGSAAGAQ